MRTIPFGNTAGYRGEIRTSNLICPAFGNNYLDIAFAQESQAIPDNVTIVSNLGGVRITKPLYFSQLANDQLDGVFFNLEWFKYYAPKSGTRTLQLSIYDNNTLIARVEYQLYAGHAEVEFGTLIDGLELGFDIDEVNFVSDIVVWAPTQSTKHFRNFEMLALKPSNALHNLQLSYVEAPTRITQVSIGYQDFIIRSGYTFNLYFNNENQTNIAKIPTPNATCADIELRITNRYGLRGAIGGKLIDSSEGGDDVKSNFNKVTPYAGIYEWSKKGATIKKEVGFNFEGDEGLLGLLRDGCVYGNVEWYDERTEQWLPCRIEEKSIGTNAWDEQIVTIVLQEL